jgi:hypothetical protein
MIEPSSTVPMTDPLPSGVNPLDIVDPPVASETTIQEPGLSSAHLELAKATRTHHIATNKSQEWKTAFMELFLEHGFTSLNEEFNLVELPASIHRSTHPHEYHTYIYLRLLAAEDLEQELGILADEIKQNPLIVTHPYWRDQ